MTLYTIGCPQCRVLETKLKQIGKTFEICSDVDMMKAKGMKSAPWIELDDGTLMDFSASLKWLKEQH